jgi:hypothetical protein
VTVFPEKKKASPPEKKKARTLFVRTFLIALRILRLQPRNFSLLKYKMKFHLLTSL